MSIASDIAEDLQDLQEDFFDTTVNFDGTDILASVSYGELPTERNEAFVSTAFLEVQTSVITPLVSDQQAVKGKNVVIDSIIWKVRELLRPDAVTWLFQLYTDERPVI